LEVIQAIALNLEGKANEMKVTSSGVVLKAMKKISLLTTRPAHILEFERSSILEGITLE
jgi:hypothetical protein